MNKIIFPKNFYWGSSISAEQSEGTVLNDGKSETTWSYWYKQEPYKFHNNIGPEKTSTIYTNYISDIDLLKETGHNAYRTSISWARLIPNGFGEVNKKAVKFYRDYFTRLKDAGIEPMVNLYHFDTPMNIQNMDGFANKKVVEYYVEYAKKCFELFGDIVKIWFTFNEPIVTIECSYLLQYHYPMEVDPKKAVQASFNISLANALAIKEYHKLNQGGKIGIILNLTPAYPRSNYPSDIDAARIAELFANKSFLDPAIKGEYDKELIDIVKKHNLMPDYTKEELNILKENTIDLLGVNYYQPLRVKAKDNIPNDNAPFMPTYYYDHYSMPGKKMNPYRGWEIYPQAIYDIAKNIQNNYGNIEWLITENGMGVENEDRFKVDSIIQDDYRIEFYKDHLTYLHKAINEGANCKGYLVWTFIDCWSWLNSYKNRYGLIELDYNTQKRTIKKSGIWFYNLSKNNGF